MEMQNADVDLQLQEDLFDMTMDLEAKALLRRKSLSDYWRSVNTVVKYPRLCAVVEPFLLYFPSSNIVEAGFNHVSAILTKQRNRLNLEEHGDLRLKLQSPTQYQCPC